MIGELECSFNNFNYQYAKVSFTIGLVGKVLDCGSKDQRFKPHMYSVIPLYKAIGLSVSMFVI